MPDLDSYYHLAVARLYAMHGLVKALPWARLSVLGDTLGDKELFFHLLLIPFASSTAGGRIAILLLNTLVLGVIAWIATLAVGRDGLWIAPWIYLTAAMLPFRTVRLRPEVLALALLLLFVAFVARSQARLAALVAFVFVESYTAAHLIAGMAVVLFVVLERRRTPKWSLLVWPLFGVAAGLVLRPHFPDNLRIFWIQNVVFFLKKSMLDVGDEINPPRLFDVLRFNLGFWAGMAVVLVTSPRRQEQRRETVAFTTAAVIAGAMYVVMERMAIYAIPLIALAVLFHAGSIARRARWALAACVVLSLPWTIAAVRSTNEHMVDERIFREAAARIPPNARVAATWGDAEALAWFAPQARYLNVLDPVFMLEKDPRAYAAQRAVFRGDEPDVPNTVRNILKSDYLFFRAGEVPKTLVTRLRNDPRARPVLAGRAFLVAFDGDDRSFVTDWRIGRLRYAGRGFVDLTAIPSPCVQAITAVAGGRYEFAPVGRGSVFLDGQPRITVAGNGATLGSGMVLTFDGPHDVVIESCRPAGSRRNGFYFRSE